MNADAALFLQVTTGIIGLSSAVIALYVALKLATMENRLLKAIDGTYVRRDLFEEYKEKTEKEIDKLRQHGHEDRGTITAILLKRDMKDFKP